MVRDAVAHPIGRGAVAEGLVDGEVADIDGGALPSRQCGRCRVLFEVDPTLDAQVRNEWWLCPPCEDAVFPRRAHNATALGARSPGGRR